MPLDPSVIIGVLNTALLLLGGFVGKLIFDRLSKYDKDQANIYARLNKLETMSAREEARYDSIISTLARIELRIDQLQKNREDDLKDRIDDAKKQ